MSLFNHEAYSYDEWYQTPMGIHVDQVETELAIRLLPVEAGMKVLDAGCGTGNFSIKLAQSGAAVTGIDISLEMLKRAKEKTEETGLVIDYRKMDLTRLEFSEAYFDCIISMAVFEFIQMPEKVMGELFRVLKPGGYLLIGTINRESSWGKLYQSSYFQKNTIFKHAYFKSLRDLQSWHSSELVTTESCLFIPPDSENEDWTIENEEKHCQREAGGFICALWKKQIK